MADTWDEEEDSEPSLMLDWATAERIVATDPVSPNSLPISTAEFVAEDSGRESGKQHSFDRGKILFKANQQLNARG
jgi:hypothetical protein